MNRLILTFTIFILSGAVICFADDPSEQVVTLKDGSQIVGELTGINNGVYTIKAPIIGNVQANAADVVSITNRHDNGGSAPTYPVQGYPVGGNPTNPSQGNPGWPGQGNPTNPGQGNPGWPGQGNPTNPGQGNPGWPNQPPDLNQRIEEEQRHLMSNPESMAILMQMAQDPEISQLLQDPALIEAVTHHDIQAVESNPRIKELMNNPKVKEFLRRLAALQHDHDHDHDHDPYTNSTQ